MCLLHLHLQLAQLKALPLACAVAMVTCAVGMWSLVGHLQTCSSQPPEHQGTSKSCQVAGQPLDLGMWALCSDVLRKWSCSAHLGGVFMLLPFTASKLPIFNMQCAPRAALLYRKPMPRVLPWTLHLGLSPSQILCRGSYPKGLE